MIRAVGLILCALVLHAPAAQAAEAARQWDFQASLDGTPIGRHVFTLTRQDARWAMDGQAEFAVKFLGIVVYRYRHVVHSLRDAAGCLQTLHARTDDDGTQDRVDLAPTDNPAMLRLAAQRGDRPELVRDVSGCLMDFAYWDPRLVQQTRLLNPQTGEVEAVTITAAGSGDIMVHGTPVAATSWRIQGAHEPIVVWYSAQGDWIGLDAAVKGGKMLSYRLP